MRFDQKRIARMSQALWKGSVLTFPTQDVMITDVVAILTLRYKEHLEFWQVTAMDDRAEYRSWENRIKEEVDPYYDALRVALERAIQRKKSGFYRLLIKIGICKNEIRIDRKHSKIIQQALSAIGSITKPNSVLPCNVTWKLDLDKNLFREVIY